IFFFLGRATDTLIPVAALPLSLLLTFVVMNLLGYSLDNLSLMALTLAIGFLIDDAIVFLENTVRRMERGEEALQAALGSAKTISFTILSMTISLAAVFIPLVFMTGLVARIFLPPGDSRVIFGAFLGREGSSPEQMRAIQDRVDATLHADPNVLMDFTMTGASGFLPSNMGITFTFIKPPKVRPPIAVVAAG